VLTMVGALGGTSVEDVAALPFLGALGSSSAPAGGPGRKGSELSLGRAAGSDDVDRMDSEYFHGVYCFLAEAMVFANSMSMGSGW
jgi:hypothetical protein